MVEKIIKNDEVWQKYEDIWDVIKNKLGIKFHSEPIYENKYLKVKVREFNGNIKTNFLGHFRFPQHIEKKEQVKRCGRKKYLIIKKSLLALFYDIGKISIRSFPKAVRK